MAIKQKTVSIKTEDGYKDFLITSLPAVPDGLAYKVKLIKILGPAFAALKGEGDLLEGKTVIQCAVDTLVERMDETEVLKIVVGLLQGVSKDSYSLKIAEEFSGDYSAMYELLIEVVKLNYGNVFTNLDSVLAKALNRVEQTQAPVEKAI